MSLGRYNLTRYNLGDTPALQYSVGYSMFATMSALFDVGSLYTPTYFISQGLSAEMPMGWGYDICTDMEQSMSANMTSDELATPLYPFITDMTAVINGSLNIMPTYYLKNEMAVEIMANISIYTQNTFNINTTAIMNDHLCIIPSIWMYQIANALFSIVPTHTTIMEFRDIVIPPGGKLVIDSDNYTVYLDNEDVIYAYSGEWIKFTRDLAGINITSGTSGILDVNVLYRERFL